MFSVRGGGGATSLMISAAMAGAARSNTTQSAKHTTATRAMRARFMAISSIDYTI
jgi:hypothetical protein